MATFQEIASADIRDSAENFTSPYIRIHSGISDEEKKAVKNRGKEVLEALKKLNKQVKKVPVVSVLVSGGGLRAAIACQGVLTELSSLGLLDLVTYIAGVSGSTWCMASLFAQKNGWQNLEKAEDEMCRRLQEDAWSLSKALNELCEAAERDDYSLTDFWGYCFVYDVTKELPAGHLSSVRDQCQKGTVPYPIFATVDLKLMSDRKKTQRAWFEFTPPAAGYPTPDYSSPGCSEPGVYVSTTHCGSKFDGGRLIKKNAERDFSYLRALCGSAPADMKIVLKTISDYLWKFITGKSIQAEVFITEAQGLTLKSSIEELNNLVHTFLRQENCLPILKKLHDNLAENEFFADTATLINQGIPKWHEISREQQLQFIQDLLSKTLREDVVKNRSFWSYLKFLKKTLWCFLTWTWGTTSNFLYKYDIKDKLLTDRKNMYLIDAGLAINSAYPLVLPPVRNSDIILSFDFSEGDPFLTIKATEEYCKACDIAFPPVDKDKLNKEADFPSDRYIFEGERSPVIMHFPLFNKQNCSSKEVIEERRKTYSTNRLSRYSDVEVHQLLKDSKENVRNNKDCILVKICTLAEKAV